MKITELFLQETISIVEDKNNTLTYTVTRSLSYTGFWIILATTVSILWAL
jgi:hypothetical protein